MAANSIPDFSGGSLEEEKEYLKFIIAGFDAPMMLIDSSLSNEEQKQVFKRMESFALHMDRYYHDVSFSQYTRNFYL